MEVAGWNPSLICALTNRIGCRDIPGLLGKFLFGLNLQLFLLQGADAAATFRPDDCQD
jgi:hypothetical protein